MPLRSSVAVVIIGLVLAACARSGPDLSGLYGRRGGTIRLADEPDIRTLDTAIGYDTASWRFERLINDGLLDYGDGADLRPEVAATMPTVIDGTTFVFRLRDDVFFHHGRRVVAEDFKYAIERILDPKVTSPAIAFFETIVGAPEYVAGRAEHVSGIRCPDPQTLIIELRQPDLAFLNVLAMPFASPLPREEVERWTDPHGGESRWAEHVIGCGPYRLERWERGLRIRVRRFERYYRDDTAFVEAVEQRFGIPDFMALMMFERGEIDISGIPLPDFQRVLADPRLRALAHSAPDSAIYYCSMNCELPPFTDKRVRQAFNYAIDKDRIARILSGIATPAKGVLPPQMPGYNPDLRGYPYDPARARRLLAEAGYPRGLSVELMTRSRPNEKRWVEAIQQDLANVGVTVAIRPVAFPEWLDLSGKRGQVPFTVNAWFMDYPDPSNFLDVLLNGTKITAQNSNNRAFYNNDRVNDLLARAAAMTDAPARLKLYQEIEQIVVDDAPWIFLYHPTTWRLVQPWVHNFRIHPVWSSTEDRVWLAPTDNRTETTPR